MATTFFQLAALTVFPALMALAAATDLLSYTIPNRLCAALALGYLALAVASGAGVGAILLNLSCALVVLLLAFGGFSLGWIGGGDAKLAAATALWLGWGLMPDYGFAAAIYGGVLTLALLAGRTAPLPAPLARTPWIARLHDAKAGVPYGVALAIAGLMQYPGSAVWAAAVA